jgi:hypothetical protein
VRSIVVAACLVLVIASCSGGGELTLNEYAIQIEELVTTMNGEIDDVEAVLRAQVATVESTQSFLDARLAARYEFLDSFQTLEPPEEAAEMHAAALDIVTKLTTAEEAIARRADQIETQAELDRLWEGPEAMAANAVDDEAIAICQAAQAQMDSTADQEVFGDVPWIPSELQEVVLVFFGCTKEERGADS